MGIHDLLQEFLKLIAMDDLAAYLNAFAIERCHEMNVLIIIN
jgi:hypothetical protein